MNLRCGLYNACQAILHEVDYPWVARAIRGWPGSATGPEHSQAIHGSATGPEHSLKVQHTASYSLRHQCNRSTAQHFAVQMTWRGPSYRAGSAHLRKARNESLTAMVQAICDNIFRGDM